MIPVNPEAIGLFGLFATVICFGLEQLGVGVKGADHEKLTRTLGYIAIFFGGFTQLFTSLCMYLFSVGGDHSVYLGTVFGFFGLFWILVGFFFIKGGDKKAMAHFFLCDRKPSLSFPSTPLKPDSSSIPRRYSFRCAAGGFRFVVCHSCPGEKSFSSRSFARMYA